MHFVAPCGCCGCYHCAACGVTVVVVVPHGCCSCHLCTVCGVAVMVVVLYVVSQLWLLHHVWFRGCGCYAT